MRTVGLRQRHEFEFDPSRAWQRGRVLDAMLRNALAAPPRGIFRATHAEMARLDEQRIDRRGAADQRNVILADPLLHLHPLARFGDEGVAYVVVGGQAVRPNGFVRATEDIDVPVLATRENGERIRGAMDFPGRPPISIPDGSSRRRAKPRSSASPTTC